MVFFAIVQGKCKEMVEEKNIIGKQDNIVSLANGRDLNRANINTKVGIMGRCQLFRVVDGIEIPRRDPALLKPKFIINRAKNLPIPFHKSFLCLSLLSR